MKLWIILTLATFVHTQDLKIRQAEMKLKTLFSEEPRAGKGATCGGIVGELDDSCNECYLCDDEKLKSYKTEPKRLQLKSVDCVTVTTVCCVPQLNLGTRAHGGTCGKTTDHVISINGRSQKKSTVRSVLFGEYPWRAWIYRKERYGDSKVLCAGTVVGESTEVVMTSASCLQGLSSSDVAISFIKNSDDVINVRKIIIHPSYTPSKKHENDIALVVLSRAQRAPGWVSPACLPAAPPLPATTCITMSDNNSYITTVVPLPKRCESFNVKSALGQICAVLPLNDYQPEKGTALLCQDELRQNDDAYYVAGIVLATSESVITTTAVHQYYDWILDRVDESSAN
ncbi:PREDICTED: putative trypsin-6 [Papilio polytes]|uniref:putative trypsin-6 n=1 Tax=Papilio polytes TaxID=76194 RepID=UPI000675F5B5|nr:PREDICTED: putative trypsin-6 [Papilio polytes]XP_013143873.1 PREDICTED: putative trypsin-6 [Papilio polytes]